MDHGVCLSRVFPQILQALAALEAQADLDMRRVALREALKKTGVKKPQIKPARWHVDRWLINLSGPGPSKWWPTMVS